MNHRAHAHTCTIGVESFGQVYRHTPKIGDMGLSLCFGFLKQAKLHKMYKGGTFNFPNRADRWSTVEEVGRVRGHKITGISTLSRGRE